MLNLGLQGLPSSFSLSPLKSSTHGLYQIFTLALIRLLLKSTVLYLSSYDAMHLWMCENELEFTSIYSYLRWCYPPPRFMLHGSSWLKPNTKNHIIIRNKFTFISLSLHHWSLKCPLALKVCSTCSQWINNQFLSRSCAHNFGYATHKSFLWVNPSQVQP